ncbi:hypothetical protein B1A_04708, partial [mine drainage metagenome]
GFDWLGATMKAVELAASLGVCEILPVGGQTTGRGKLAVTHQHAVPVKDIWLYPLSRHFRAFLCK